MGLLQIFTNFLLGKEGKNNKMLMRFSDPLNKPVVMRERDAEPILIP